MEKIECYKTSDGIIFEDRKEAEKYETLVKNEMQEILLRSYVKKELENCPYGSYISGRKKWSETKVIPENPLIESLLQTPELMIKIANEVIKTKNNI